MKNTRKICVVTGTRAEYHLLTPLLRRVVAEPELELQLLVTGAHLSEKYGNTYQDIEKDGFSIAAKIPILNDTDTVSDINSAISRAIIGFDQYMKSSQSDMLVLLGDRYEMLAAAIVAMNYRVPIAHLYGGETTEGAVDECIRHAITKMSYLHFTSCEAYRKRVIQLGEDPQRVYNVGGLGVENIKNTKCLTLPELEESISFKLSGTFVLVTFHPVTLDDQSAESQFAELLEALNQFPNLRVLFTKANADSGGNQINQMIDTYVAQNSERCTAVFSLGMKRYISALSYAAAVIGNSSSGILETPSFAVPTVNIGDRQKGRIQAKNIINCRTEKEEIKRAVEKAISKGFRVSVKDAVNPYGDGNTSEKIIEQINKAFEDGIHIKKEFYNIDFSVGGKRNASEGHA